LIFLANSAAIFINFSDPLVICSLISSGCKPAQYIRNEHTVKNSFHRRFHNMSIKSDFVSDIPYGLTHSCNAHHVNLITTRKESIKPIDSLPQGVRSVSSANSFAQSRPSNPSH
jgi:hypothetical protein